MPNGSRVPFARVPVDMVGAHERADSFTKRSIKNESKLAALYAATTMLDLTTLEGMDTPGKVRQLCSKARHPVSGAMMQELLDKKPGLAPIPSVAAVCVYPSLVPYAKEYLQGSGIKVAAVSTAFPSGQAPLDVKLLDVKRACQLGVVLPIHQ